jgi:hypothetical protein
MHNAGSQYQCIQSNPKIRINKKNEGCMFLTRNLWMLKLQVTNEASNNLHCCYKSPLCCECSFVLCIRCRYNEPCTRLWTSQRPCNRTSPLASETPTPTAHEHVIRRIFTFSSYGVTSRSCMYEPQRRSSMYLPPASREGLARHIVSGFTGLLPSCRNRKTELSEKVPTCTATGCLKNAVFWDIKTQSVPHRRHVTSPLKSPAG